VLGGSLLLVGLLLAVLAAPLVADNEASATRLPGWLHTEGSRIETASGHTYVIKAVSWSGLQRTTCHPGGLRGMQLDYGFRIIRRLGFNTIRLPYATECLDPGRTPTGIDYGAHPEFKGLSVLGEMDLMVSTARKYGLTVILDHHRSYFDRESPLWYAGPYTERRFIDDWTALARRYRSQSNVIGFDLDNEPHGACWGCGRVATDWRLAAERTADAVQAVNPRLLIFVEGVGREASTRIDGGAAFWGGGLSYAAKYPVRLNVAHRLVYSTHEYGPSQLIVTGNPLLPRFTAADYPRNLPRAFDRSFGYLVRKGIAPVWIGEMGFTARTQADRLWGSALTQYARQNGISTGVWALDADADKRLKYGLLQDDWKTLAGFTSRAAAALNGVPSP
jgi:endoglucanase